MSVVHVTCLRTVGRARNLLATSVAGGLFLAAVAALFSFNLEAAEGGRMPLAALWAVSASPVLPVLAALLGMGVWSDERQSGRTAVLLSTAVRERDLVLGKFAGVLALVMFFAALSLAGTLGMLFFIAPQAVEGSRALAFLPALLGIFVQAILWCAVSVAASALCTRGALAAALSVVLTVGLPRGLWKGLMAWSDKGRTAFGEMPFDAHVLDIASGVVPVGVVMAYLVLALVLLFVASKLVASLRLVGRRARVLRLTTGLSVFLAGVFSVLVVLLASCLGVTLDIPVSGPSSQLSLRTRDILTETGGDVTVTCFLPRKDARFRSVGRILRLLKRESEAVGGARLSLQYVDPRWDIGAAERLVRRGVAEDSLVFEKGRRMVVQPFRDGYGERTSASAIRRLTVLPRHRNVCWTVGHGECRFDEYGAYGMSDIARDLSREGYLNKTLDLAAAQRVPEDCALVVIAGARRDFSRVELGRIDAYLHDGGRLLVLLDSDRESGVTSLLSSWGIRAAKAPPAGGPTLSGSDVIVLDFADHPVSAPLRGSRIVLERLISFAPSAAVEAGSGADRLGFTSLAVSGTSALAALVERGGGAGGDLAIRPTRVVAVGDAGFVTNGKLASRANANRDFFLNCASYLSGTDVAGSNGDEADVLVTGMDRAGRFKLVVWTAGVFPGAVFLVLALVALRRRFRS